MIQLRSLLIIVALAAPALLSGCASLQGPAAEHQGESPASAHTDGGKEPAGQPQVRAKGFDPRLLNCHAENSAPFDGKLLYDCVLKLAEQEELALLDGAKRQAFIKKWQRDAGKDLLLESEPGAIREIKKMVADLGQMHTAFYSSVEFKDLMQRLEARYGGIGAQMMQKGMANARKRLGKSPTEEEVEKAFVISSKHPLVLFPAPFDGSPAARAGLLEGDRIIAVDGKPLDGQSLQSATDAIRGEPGTSVLLTIGRNGRLPFTVKLTRQEIAHPVVTTRMLGGGIGMLKLRAFASDSMSVDTANALYRLCTGADLPADGQGGVTFPESYDVDTDCRLKGAVLDLRGNTGGDFKHVKIIAQFFMERGPLVTTLTRDGDRIVEERVVIGPDFMQRELALDGVTKETGDLEERFPRLLPSGLPLVVLIDEGSASASEILAGLLQKNGIATIAGKPSFGKQVGQTVLRLAFGTAFKPTTFRFKPGDVEMGAAVIPDIEIEQSSSYIDDPMHNADAQELKAMEVLRALIAKNETGKQHQLETARQHEERNAKLMERSLDEPSE